MLYPDAPGLWKEVDLQKAVAGYLDDLARLGALAWSHPPNEGKRSPITGRLLKLCGMKAGEPDCIIFLKGAVTIFIELKLNKSLQPVQVARHKALEKLGYKVYTVKAKTPQEAVREVAKHLFNHGVKEAL